MATSSQPQPFSANQLKCARASYGSQKAFAQALGLNTAGVVSRWEKGRPVPADLLPKVYELLPLLKPQPQPKLSKAKKAKKARAKAEKAKADAKKCHKIFKTSAKRLAEDAEKAAQEAEAEAGIIRVDFKNGKKARKPAKKARKSAPKAEPKAPKKATKKATKKEEKKAAPKAEPKAPKKATKKATKKEEKKAAPKAEPIVDHASIDPTSGEHPLNDRVLAALTQTGRPLDAPTVAEIADCGNGLAAIALKRLEKAGVVTPDRNGNGATRYSLADADIPAKTAPKAEKAAPKAKKATKKATKKAKATKTKAVSKKAAKGSQKAPSGKGKAKPAPKPAKAPKKAPSGKPKAAPKASKPKARPVGSAGAWMPLVKDAGSQREAQRRIFLCLGLRRSSKYHPAIPWDEARETLKVAGCYDKANWSINVKKFGCEGAESASARWITRESAREDAYGYLGRKKPIFRLVFDKAGKRVGWNLTPYGRRLAKALVSERDFVTPA